MLSRDTILDAGLEVLHQGGPQALTMRSLAQRLGVTATAIYYHYESRDELLEAIVDRVCERIVAGCQAEGPWDDRLRALMISMIDDATAHPAVIAWIVTEYGRKRPVLRIHELILDLAHAGGLDPDTAMNVKGALLRFCVGHLTLRSAASGPSWRTLPKRTFPQHWAAGEAIDRFDADAHYRAGIDVILAGFEATRSAPGRRRRSA